MRRSVDTRYGITILGAMRPHFFAFPVGATYAGVAATGRSLSPVTLILLGAIAAGGWGVGQLLNDVLDQKADAIDAPQRPAVRGLLPVRPTLWLATLFGLGLFAILALLTPRGVILGSVAVALILTYNPCKALPVLGNLSHGALLACAALMGAATADQETALFDLAARHLQTLLLVGTWAALYLQANYEKDLRGDAAAGYRTLAHVLGVRASAVTRASVALAFLFIVPEHARELPYSLPIYSAALGVAVSALYVARQGTQHAALGSYRIAVHGGTLAMLAFGGAALGNGAYFSLLGLAVLLTEGAFRRSENP